MDVAASTGRSIQKPEERKYNEKLLEPITLLLQRTNIHDRFVSSFVKAFNYWLKVPADELLLIENCFRMGYTSVSMMNELGGDLEAELDKNSSNPHAAFGIPFMINSTYYATFIAVDKMMALEHPKVPELCIQQLMNFHRGHGIELLCQENSTCPTEEEYFQIANNKNSPIKLCVELMQLFSSNQADFSELTSAIILFAQINQDCHNLKNYSDCGPNGCPSDITVGKFNFPIIHAINNCSDGKCILSILRKKTNNYDMKKFCYELIEESGSFEYTKNKLRNLREKIRKAVQKHGGNPYFESVIDALSNNVI